MADFLPDSRLRDRSFGSVMADVECPDGSTARVEMVSVYCASCGKHYGYVPSFMTFVCWLCRKCFDRHGGIPATWAAPEEEFNLAVAHEMEARFGRVLSDAELSALKEQGRLGRPLELLERESPYPIPGG